MSDTEASGNQIVAGTVAADDKSIDPVQKLKWSEHSFIYVLLSFIVLPKSAILWLLLFFFGLINLKKDPWHKNKFLVFLVVAVAFISLLQGLFMRVVS